MTKIVCRVLILLFVSQSVWAIESKRDQIAALDSLIAELKTHYGMAKFKERQYGVTLEGLREKYANLVDKAETLEESYGWQPAIQRQVLPRSEFRQLLLGLVSEMRDGHTNISSPTDSVASLGMSTAVIDGRLYITGFSRDLFNGSEVTETLKVNDEIVSINGVSVQDLARKNIIYMSDATFEARFEKAMNYTVLRPFAYLRPVKDGEAVDIEFRRGDQIIQGRFHWLIRDELFRLQQIHPRQYPPDKSRNEDAPAPYGSYNAIRSYFRSGLMRRYGPHQFIDFGMQLNQQIERYHALGLLQNPTTPQEPGDSESSIASIKPMASTISPVTRMAAYAFREHGKMIGVIRIPSYSPGSFDEALNELNWLSEIIKTMDTMVDVFVIDQLSNGGGYVYYGSKVAGLFAKNQVLHSVTADLKLSESLLNTLKPYYGPAPDTGKKPNFAQYRMSEIYYQQLKEKWDRGEKWSGPIPYMDNGLDSTEGNQALIFPPVQGATDKPVLFLNDHFSASGGDFVPAILQSNGRVVVYGETSRGLGGPVYRSVDALPGSEMGFRCTYAYCERADGLPIENLGVVPDIFRAVTSNDLQEGFGQYSQDVIAAAALLAEGKTSVEIQKVINMRQVMRSTRSDMMMRRLPVQQRLRTFESSAEFKANDLQTVNAYKNLKVELMPVINDLKAEDWRGILLPIPDFFRRDDILLAALWRRDEMMERLEDLKRMNRYAVGSDAAQILDAVLDILSVLPSEVRTADPCNRILQLLGSADKKHD